MARLVIHVDIDIDPALEDPEEVADEILVLQYAGCLVDFRHAAWEPDTLRQWVQRQENDWYAHHVPPSLYHSKVELERALYDLAEAGVIEILSGSISPRYARWKGYRTVANA